MGPYELGGDWSDKGIVGVDRFVQRVYTMFESYSNVGMDNSAKDKYDLFDLNETEKSIYRKVNLTIQKTDTEIENFRFNTAVAALMELLNEMKSLGDCRMDLQSYALERFAVMIAPLAPHLGEECWKLIGKETALFESSVTYEVDKNALNVDSVLIVVQVNGKVRAKIELPANLSETEVKNAVFADEKVKLNTDGKQLVKEIYVPNKIYNIVVK
jgi:leucyl-tRNA synthetase